MNRTMTSLALIALTTWVAGQPGQPIRQVPLPAAAQGSGVSVALDCAGRVFYTVDGRADLIQMDRDGNLLAVIPVRDPQGVPRNLDELGYDAGRNVLWACEHGTNPIEVWRVDPVTGLAIRTFVSQTLSIGAFRPGLAYDASDDSLWLNGYTSTTIDHYTTTGTMLGSIIPRRPGGKPWGLLSGVAVGVGNQLYLGRDGQHQVVRVRKTDGGFIDIFPSPGGEGLECDAVNFFPRLAVWSREHHAPGYFAVAELQADSCACGGRQNEPPLYLAPTPHSGSTIEGSVGIPITFPIRVADIDPNQRVTLSVTGLPAGATITPVLPGPGNPVAGVFNWTPNNTQNGCFEITCTARDDADPPAQAECRWRVCVAECYLIGGIGPVAIPLAGEDLLYVLPPPPPTLWFPVTLSEIPDFPIPPQPEWTGVQICLQVLMYNPIVFPSDPLKTSNGLQVVIGRSVTEYGARHGMHLFGVWPPVPGQVFRAGFRM